MMCSYVHYMHVHSELTTPSYVTQQFLNYGQFAYSYGHRAHLFTGVGMFLPLPPLNTYTEAIV